MSVDEQTTVEFKNLGEAFEYLEAEARDLDKLYAQHRKHTLELLTQMAQALDAAYKTPSGITI